MIGRFLGKQLPRVELGLLDGRLVCKNNNYRGFASLNELDTMQSRNLNKLLDILEREVKIAILIYFGYLRSQEVFRKL